ncbi:MAG: hypothetical protein M3174_04080 [Actinomycetota bacterium]|nr:hypothetical protein [Actinomycetota bacterium]
MTSAVTVLVVLGVAVALALGLAAGFDSTAVIIFAFVVLFGALAIAAARKARSGAVSPGRCPECGGLVSPNAPYCKHCGVQL